jgi:hypothetical protein
LSREIEILDGNARQRHRDFYLFSDEWVAIDGGDQEKDPICQGDIAYETRVEHTRWAEFQFRQLARVCSLGGQGMARQSGWDERDNQDGDLQSRRGDD